MSTLFSLSVPSALSCLLPTLTSQLFPQCCLSVLCFLGMQLDNTFTFCKEVPPGLLAFAPVLWFAAQRVSLMQPSVGLHFNTENNTKGYFLTIGLQAVSPNMILSCGLQYISLSSCLNHICTLSLSPGQPSLP